MIRLMPSTLAADRPAPRRASLLDRLRRHLAQIEAAHDRHARFDRLPDGIARDTGLSPEDVIGASRNDPALPFFFQSRPDSE